MAGSPILYYPVPVSDPKEVPILLVSSLTCRFCGMVMLGRTVNKWPDGSITPKDYVTFLVDHGDTPEYRLDLDCPIPFCPNNGKQFFVAYQLCVIPVDIP